MNIYEKDSFGSSGHGIRIIIQENKKSLERVVIEVYLGRRYRYRLERYAEQSRESTRHRLWTTDRSYNFHARRSSPNTLTGEEAMACIPEELWHEIRVHIFKSIDFTHENSLQ